MTTADENILSSPNLLESGQFLEILINRKILEPDLRYKDLTVGDRNAIMIWLRATGYGEMYPVTLLDNNQDVFDTEVNLNDLKTKKLGVEPDENGLFSFTLPISKTQLKFKLLTCGDLDNIEAMIERDNEKKIPVNNTTTYRFEKMIVEVDGNRDKSFLKDDRIELYDNKVNLGGSGSRNIGIFHSKGQFVTFLDSDDEYLPDKVKLQVELFKNSKIPNLGVVNCGRFDQRNDQIYSKWIPKFRGDVTIPLLSKDKVGSNTSLLMVSREVLDSGLKFDENMPAGQDWDFLIRICLKFNMDFVDQNLVIIHHHDGPRVYDNLSAVKAYQMQLVKYNDLLKRDLKVFKKFSIRKALVEFVNQEKTLAIGTLNDKAFENDLLINLWKRYFKFYKTNSSISSKILLKILLYISFD
jgi:glycosyltransferase involved in cell wall biosynthesis